MTPELSEDLMPYAEWLEDFIRSIVEMKPARIGVVQWEKTVRS